ncbi:MAG: divalent metal cation transporter [Armatimonadota bacterium]|nr:divalent metal cation transporter [Armatimonadota bacterium]MCX7778185.1 divalent metal cation transporter [Armatimonadota bacterium]MDW8026222.1 divalent metal cation transporter [Armatimonadota bacterium]
MAELTKGSSEMAELLQRPLLSRLWIYFKLSGPGYLQSAFTLGSGTASACVLAGAKYGYMLLWVHPLAIIMGVIMLSAIAKQTLATGLRPYTVFAERLHIGMALFWGVAALLASIIWHFPQYALAGSVISDLAELAGISIPRWLYGGALLLLAIAISWSYSYGIKGVRLYEHSLRAIVLGILLAMFLVVLKTGVNWGEALQGFLIPRLPSDPKGLTIVMGGIGASVGINMVFLYPYSLLKRGWRKEHTELAYFDLWMGMALPFMIATSLIIIATANVIHPRGVEVKGAGDVAHILGELMGESASRIFMGLGLLGMALSTITLHMLTSGFIVCEMLNRPHEGWVYRLSMLIPSVGVLGVAYSELPFWVAVFASSICLLFIPAVYIGFFILHNSLSYMGEEKPTGVRALVWNAAMLVAITFIGGGAVALWVMRVFLTPR